MEVTNSFKGLDLVDGEPRELWTEVHDIAQKSVTKIIQKKKKCKKANWLSEEALQIAEKIREVKGKGERERYAHLNAEFLRKARRDKKAFLVEQCKEIEENNRMKKIESSSRKLEISREQTFQARTDTIKDRNGKDLTGAEEIKKR